MDKLRILVFVTIYTVTGSFSVAQRFDPKNCGILHFCCLEHYDRGEYAEAMQWFKKARSMAPYLSENYRGIGEVYRARGETETAIQWFKKAVEKDENDIFSYIALGWRYIDLWQWPEATKYFEHSLKLNSRKKDNGITADIYKGLGLIHLQQKHYEEATLFFKKAISYNPQEVFNYMGLSRIYRENHDYSKARKWAQKAIEINSRNSRAYESMARVYWDQGEYAQANIWFEKAIKINPDDAYSLEGLGRTALRLGDYEKAVEVFTASIDRSSRVTYSCPYQGLGIAYQMMGKSGLAEDALLKAVEENPRRSEMYFNLIAYYIETGSFTRAEDIIRQVSALHLTEEEKWKKLSLQGFIFLVRQEYAQARKAYMQITEDTESFITLSGLGHLANAEGQYNQARRYFNKALSCKVNDMTTALLGLGWVNANEHRYREAQDLYRGVLKRKPFNIFALLGLYEAYREMGEYDKAEKCSLELLKINQRCVYVLRKLERVGKGKEKTPWPQKLSALIALKEKESQKERENGKVVIDMVSGIGYKQYNGLARIYLYQGRREEACELLNKLIKKYPDNGKGKELFQNHCKGVK